MYYQEKRSVQDSMTKKKIVPTTISIDKNLAEKPHSKNFEKKIDAVEYIKNNPNKNLYLISQDLSTKGHKNFYSMDYETLYSLTSTKKQSLYENYEKEDNVKLFLDIDMKTKEIPKDANHMTHFNNILLEIMDIMKLNLAKYDIYNQEIIILSACREDKLSAHIIYNNVYFEDIFKMKFFIMQIDSELIKKKIIDPNVYKPSCLRMLWCSKLGKNNNLELDRVINYKFVNNKKLFMDSLIRNINKKCQLVKINIPENIKIVNKRQPVVKKDSIINDIQKNNSKISIEIIKKYLNLLSSERYTNYNDWIQIGMIIFNCQPNNSGFDLWNEWSSKDPNYCGQNICSYKWTTFNFSTIGIGTLKQLAKQDDPLLYAEIEYSLEKKAFYPITFNLDYLLKKEENIADGSSFVAQKLLEWINSKTVKTLAIRSTYDTSKTTMVKKLLNEFDTTFKRVLFVSYRQTLTNDLHGNFIELKVKSYLDRMFQSDRLICQIESLEKIVGCQYAFCDEIDIPSYDLVVLDEIESILNHYESTTINEKEKIFNLLNDIIYNSDKVLALDGDLFNRSYDYIKNIEDYRRKNCEYIILENQVKKNRKHFKFTGNKIDYDKKIDDDIKIGKKIIIISMSASVAEQYYNKYKDSVKCVLHTSKADDQLKEELKNVNDFWIKFDLLIYSPQVESGVNFDVPHFDKIYVVLSTNSTSQRALLQMCSRARKIKESTIMVYLNSLVYKIKASFYKYDEMKEYVLEMYENYLSKKVIINEDTKKRSFKYEFTLYNKILVHNLVEKMNKGSYYFVPYLLKLFDEKGHTYELLEGKNICQSINKGTIMKDSIIEAKDIDMETYIQLNKLVKSNMATRENKLSIEKYVLKKIWNIEEINDNFMEKFYGKNYILHNLKHLIGKKQISPYTYNIDETVLKFSEAEENEQKKIINQVLTILGYNNVQDDKKIEKKIFDDNIAKVLKNCDLFSNQLKYEPLFRLRKCRINFECKEKENTKNKKFCSTKAFLGFINVIFKNWGFQIKSKKYSVRINKKVEKIVKYEIKFINDIDKYV